MNVAIMLLAILGFAAAAGQLLRALLVALGTGVESFLAREVTEVNARRGDLTALQEAESRHKVARRARFGAVARVSFWTALLAIPPFTPWTAILYACYSPLWLLGGLRRA
jgi:hypothetical protein